MLTKPTATLIAGDAGDRTLIGLPPPAAAPVHAAACGQRRPAGRGSVAAPPHCGLPAHLVIRLHRTAREPPGGKPGRSTSPVAVFATAGTQTPHRRSENVIATDDPVVDAALQIQFPVADTSSHGGLLITHHPPERPPHQFALAHKWRGSCNPSSRSLDETEYWNTRQHGRQYSAQASGEPGNSAT